jgi:hypothetical protein
MSKSKVYWIDLRTDPSLNILMKLEKLLRAAVSPTWTSKTSIPP